MATTRKFIEGAKHGRSCYNAGCDCEVGRRANSEYLKDYRARKRVEQLAAAGVEVPADEPPAEEPEPEPDDPAVIGPIEKALAADLESDDGEPKYLEAVALTVARALDGVARIRRHDLVSPLAQRLVDVGARLFPPLPGSPGESDDEQRAKLLLLMGGDEGDEAAAGGA
jgi:hypothetical protein